MDDQRNGERGERTNLLGVTNHKEFNTEQAFARFNAPPKMRLGPDGEAYPIPADQQRRSRP